MSTLETRKARPRTPESAKDEFTAKRPTKHRCRRQQPAIPGTVGRLIYPPSLYAYLDDLAKAEKM